MAAAGFSVGEAEGLRRAMSRKRSEEAIEAFRPRFVEGCLGNGIDERTGHVIYDKLVGFSGFGFPKSHAAAFGLLAYQSAWLRRYFPAEFLCSLLNAQPMGFYPPSSLVRDAQRRGRRGAPAAREPEQREVHDRRRRGADRPRLYPLGRRGRGPRGRGRAAVRRCRRSRTPRARRPASGRGARRLGRLRRVGGKARPALAARRHPARRECRRRRPAARASDRADRGDPELRPQPTGS